MLHYRGKEVTHAFIFSVENNDTADILELCKTPEKAGYYMAPNLETVLGDLTSFLDFVDTVQASSFVLTSQTNLIGIVLRTDDGETVEWDDVDGAELTGH